MNGATRRPTSSRSRRGATLLETSITLTLFPLIIGACFMAMRSEEVDRGVLGARADMVRTADTALSIVTLELERSGFVNVNGIDYPFFVEGVDVVDTEAPHGHAPAAPAPDGGATAREVVFVAPRDDDGDGWPDLNASMTGVDWDPTEISYVLIDDGNGSNELVRREDGVDDRVLARGVRRFLVEDAVSTGFAFPVDMLRIRLEVEDSGIGDQQQVLAFTRLVTLPNGTERNAD